MDVVGINGEAVVEGALRRVPITRIMTSRWQPRAPAFDGETLWELTKSIGEHGLINPIVVFEADSNEDGSVNYELVAGERRTRAVLAISWAAWDDDQSSMKDAVMALASEGFNAVPAGVWEELENAGVTILARVVPGDDLAALHQLAVIENIEREGLTPLEEARALHGLQQDLELSQRDLAAKIGKSQSYIAQRLSLLGLTEEAQVAVSTRVLTATHARAIAGVPAELQPAFTDYVLDEVQRSDSPATTRQLQNRARELAAFVDPDRWLPNGERVYTPEQRNRLAWIRHILSGVDLEERGESILGLMARGYSQRNVLGMSPLNVVDSGYMGDVLAALGHAGGYKSEWATAAPEMGRTCQQCTFRDVEPVRGEIDFLCPKSKSSCFNFIGADDPVVIPIGDFDARWYDAAGIELETEPFPHLTSVEGYIRGLQVAIEAKEASARQREEERSQRHLAPMRRYLEWTVKLGTEVNQHFQAHSCFKCKNFIRSPNQDPAMMPCRFAVDPLEDWRGPREPGFGVLVMEDGTLLPRCEQFVYRETPKIATSFIHQINLPMDEALEWMHGLAVSGYNINDKSVIWGVLRWLDYGRPVKAAQDYAKLERYVAQHWADLGSDAGIATLLTTTLSESRFRSNRTRMPATLFNPVTGEEEEFCWLSFDSIVNQKVYWNTTNNWPEGWPRPWENTEIREEVERELADDEYWQPLPPPEDVFTSVLSWSKSVGKGEEQ